MSEILRVGYVVEGKTDYIILDVLIENFLGEKDYISTQIQPPTSEYINHQGPLGGGWKGVLKWCEHEGATPGGFAQSLPFLNYDYLIIHVDADIATEAELQARGFSAPCPPAKDTCDRLRHHLIALLGNSLPAKVLLCIPAQCMEAWVFAALHPDMIASFQPIECRQEVERLLIGKPDRLVRDHEGRARKDSQRYKKVAQRITAGWPQAIATCPEAQYFDNSCRAALPP